MIKFLKTLVEFMYSSKIPTGLSEIQDLKTLIKQFDGDSVKSDKKIYRAYEKAWDARKHEIDNYWKRATYFWAFQVASLTAYVLIVNSAGYNEDPRLHPFTLFFSIAIGYITSLAWVLTNIGSKFWQRHWEKQIDVLEDENTGPLYKTLYAYKTTKTYSVSKINEIISRFFVLIWIAFGINYFVENITITCQIYKTAYVELIIFIGAFYFTVSMFKGYGRGQFGGAQFKFYNRKVFKED